MRGSGIHYNGSGATTRVELEYFQTLTLTDSKNLWPPINVIRIIPREGKAWGHYHELASKPWAAMVQEVSGEAYSHALHGWLVPLAREMGNPPAARVRRLPREYRWCALSSPRGLCISAGSNCRICGNMPECFTPRDAGEEGGDLLQFVRVTILGIKEVRHALVVVGSEFVML